MAEIFNFKIDYKSVWKAKIILRLRFTDVHKK